MAKAPVPGLAKTRLAAVVGDDAAAELAAAGLLDAIAACNNAGAEGVIALTGVLEHAKRVDEIRAALAGWTLLWQRGEGFDERLANAHLDAGSGPLLQIGMDTPQVTPQILAQAATALDDHDAVLGPAEDGGWWVLGRHEPEAATALIGVPMSTSRTCAETEHALTARGLRVGIVQTLRDVDTVTDADAVATAYPDTHFARVWAETGVTT